MDVARDALWRDRRLTEPWEQVDAAREAPVSFARPPHIVFLMLDTLRADALAALGGAGNVMPRANERVHDAFLFTDVHANASWTRASCASIFTGLLPEEHGAARFHERLATEWHTLPERLQEAGYQTAAFVANWVQVGRETGFAQGFAEGDFHELMSAEEILAQAGDDAPASAVRGAYARAATVNAAVRAWLDGGARDPYRPLFLYVHYLDPHAPYLEPPEPGNVADPRERKRGLYRQQLRYLDHKVDELLSDLEARLGPLVVILTSDHGEEFWEHDDWGHGHTLYRELVWVPLVVATPGGVRGMSDAALESRDLYALVLDLAGEPDLDLAGWARAHARATRYASQYLDRVAAARDDRKWTGLRRVDSGGRALIWSAYGPTLELYDEARDPHELDNAIGRWPDRARELETALEASVRFWTAPQRVERGPRDLALLRALGYAGGVEAP
jgi:arylsulfatase A-like enzyme